ncbi:MAG: rhodanese-like domain-containing protein [Planctomycetes bacterium]|nr:rhodanese-like domain-containing protein [Planctomycetota bacterium]
MDYDLDVIESEVKSGKAQLFDVREVDEWQEGHLAAAALVPLSDLQMNELPEKLNPDLPTYLHCKSGRRVFAAQPCLEEMGFKKVIPLHEGFEELLSLGFTPADD